MVTMVGDLAHVSFAFSGITDGLEVVFADTGLIGHLGPTLGTFSH